VETERSTKHTLHFILSGNIILSIPLQRYRSRPRLLIDFGSWVRWFSSVL